MFQAFLWEKHGMIILFLIMSEHSELAVQHILINFNVPRITREGPKGRIIGKRERTLTKQDFFDDNIGTICIQTVLIKSVYARFLQVSSSFGGNSMGH